MKRFALVLAAALIAQAALVALCAAPSRPGDPKPDEVAKIQAAIPKQATVKPAKPRKMLILSYQSHDSGRFAGEKALELMAKQTGAFEPTFIRTTAEMAEVLVPEKLAPYDAVCVNNSTGGAGNAANGKTLVQNLNDYVEGGGGLVGIHAATDNRFGEVFGDFFAGHPWSEQVGVKIDEPEHVLCKAFGDKGFLVRDEIYQFNKLYSREKLRVLLSLDMAQTKDKGARKDKDHAVAWIKTLGKGRVFYCSLGHNPQIFQDAKLLQFYLDGIQYALGDLPADATPSAKLPKPPTPALAPATSPAGK